MKNLKRVAAVLIAAQLAIACGGCAQGTAPASSAAQPSSTGEAPSSQEAVKPTEAAGLEGIDWEGFGWKADPADLEWKQDTSPVKLSYYANFSWFSLNWQDDTSRRVTEKTGVDLDFSKPVSDDNQKLNMMIAGKQLPDIMTVDRNDPSLQVMIDAGLLWSLDELIDQYAPKMKDIIPKEVLENYKSKDGKTYRFTTWVQGEAWQTAARKYDQIVGTNQPVWTIRKDYYDEINRPEIKTFEDFVKVLEQINAKHSDKIAFYPADRAMSSDSFATSACMGNVGVQFGLSLDKVPVDGKVQWIVRDPAFVNAIESLNQLYKKGLMTKDSFIDSKDVAKSKIEKGDVVSYSWTISDGEKAPADNPNTNYEILPPFEDYAQMRTGAGWLATVIPKSCSNPERAIRFLEYLASEEGHMDVSWGVRGDTYGGDVIAGPQWNLVDGKPTMLPEYVVDKNKDWGGVASKNGLGEYWIACNETLWNLPWWDASDERMSKFNQQFGPKVTYRPELDIVDPDPSSEEGVIRQKAFSLLQQSSVKMIFADDPIQEYNAFIKAIDDLGMSRVESYWNDQYQQKLAK